MANGVIGNDGQVVVGAVEKEGKQERGVVQILLHRGEEANVGEIMRKSGSAIYIHVIQRWWWAGGNEGVPGTSD